MDLRAAIETRQRNAIDLPMRNLLLTVTLLIVAVATGCNSSDQHIDPLTDGGSDHDGGIDGGSDGGIDGGADGGRDGGTDGGTDGGLDGGLQCDNSVETVPQEERFHVPEGEPVFWQHNPPVQGMHYPIWARWQSYTEVIPRGYWVHNLEHGGVVFLYHPDAGTDLVLALTRIYNAIPNDPACEPPGPVHKRAILTPDPLLDVPWAVTVSGPEPDDGGFGFGFDIKASCIASEANLVQFAIDHRNMGAEHICDEGFYP